MPAPVADFDGLYDALSETYARAAAVLGETADAPGWFNACGFSGHGVQQAAAVGRIVAAEVVGEEPFIDVTGLRLERFARAAGVRERHLV